MSALYEKAARAAGYRVYRLEHAPVERWTYTTQVFDPNARPRSFVDSAAAAWRAACIDQRIDLVPHLDEFTTQYLTAALWSTPTDNDSGLSLLATHRLSGFDPAALADAFDTCQDFQESQAADLAIAYAQHKPGWYTPAMAGFDFWLSRNGHGAGFHDRGMKELGDALHRAAKVYSGIDLYIGDDGALHFTGE